MQLQLVQEQQPVQGRSLEQVLQVLKKMYQPQRKQTSQLKNLTCVNHEKNLQQQMSGQCWQSDLYLLGGQVQARAQELVPEQLQRVRPPIWAGQ